MKTILTKTGRLLAVVLLMALYTECSNAQQMFVYKDKNGKTLTQAQVDALDKKFGGFLIVEFLSDEEPITVQVSAPTPAELQVIKAQREEETAELKKKWLGKPLPPFSFENLAGKTFGQAQLTGKKTVLFFWSRNDYGSLNQMNALNQLAKNNNNKSLQFWAPTFEDAVLVKEFLKKYPMSYEIMPNNFEFVMQEMAIMQTPVSMILDSRGVVRFISTSTQRNIDQTIKQELAKIK